MPGKSPSRFQHAKLTNSIHFPKYFLLKSLKNSHRHISYGALAVDSAHILFSQRIVILLEGSYEHSRHVYASR